jgi:hypothetical protein
MGSRAGLLDEHEQHTSPAGSELKESRPERRHRKNARSQDLLDPKLNLTPRRFDPHDVVCLVFDPDEKEPAERVRESRASLRDSILGQLSLALKEERLARIITDIPDDRFNVAHVKIIEGSRQELRY